VGYWLPGGRVNNGEKLTKAAIRECKEEVGIDIKITGILTI
jgi:8-oxo-dGTP diphosphatase